MRSKARGMSVSFFAVQQCPPFKNACGVGLDGIAKQVLGEPLAAKQRRKLVQIEKD
jgi:hypothetical protein